MMTKTLQIKQDILTENKRQASKIRDRLRSSGTYMVNIMASPGSGKTSSILRVIEQLGEKISIAVVEGDIDSMVDSQKVENVGVPSVQIQTGGACHLDVPMVSQALDLIDLDATDLVFVENIGNLVCPAEFDIGADLQLMILSVPEGDDKILKYPLMFTICDVLVVNKVDYLTLPSNSFSIEHLIERMKGINPGARIFKTSAYTGEGFDELCSWLESRVADKKTDHPLDTLGA